MTDDATLRRILSETRTIALIAASMKPQRASHRVGQFLVAKGYKVIPVNPGHAGKTLFGQSVVGFLADIKEPVDLVDIFHSPNAVLPVVKDALAHLNGVKTIWMQLGIENAEARSLAEGQGLTVVEDRCPAIEYPRLMG